MDQRFDSAKLNSSQPPFVKGRGDSSGKRVLVGMSGGVDSSVAAALLVEQGFDVEGVFLKVWSEHDVTQPRNDSRKNAEHPTSEVGYEDVRSSLTSGDGQGLTPEVPRERIAPFVACPWEEDLKDARAVAEQLGITLHVLNVQREYFTRVVSEMKAGYAAGITPNPDVLCNSEIKFGLLYDWAMEQGFEYVATGHYARSQATEKLQIPNPKSQPSSNFESQNNLDFSEFGTGTSLEFGAWNLGVAADPFKDQTYFLWRVPRERFERILFPIGHLQKSEVRKIAMRLGLKNATKPDSQGICFLGNVDVRAWLKRELGSHPGDVIDRDGRVVGRHDGAGLYTIGQRHGLGIFGGGPVYYVVEKDLVTNTIVVDEKPAAMQDAFTIGQCNWLVDGPLDRTNLDVRIRHQGERIKTANIELRTANEGETANSLRFANSLAVRPSQFAVTLASPAFGVASGQSVVLYRGDVVVGGGVIQ